ncbi:EMG1 [Blepharisma stoltei]|uniref:Ribosomal RNA small subunit methyltransferase NEP1 n=1 Tax=Blepharisma stoltei TaxID=1481888 RepID=A0AAU9KCA9_9CILI|nr:unnamed protein product [Blepharisma stoltei]
MEEEGQKVIFVLEGATLDTAKIKKDGEFVLLNSDDHTNYLKKIGVDPAEYRPDITHQTLLALLDSPLAKAGKIQVYIHTFKNVLIYVSPQLRMPRTYKRFAGLITQLLHTRKIKAADNGKYLMRVIKNPITDHLPVGSIKIGTSVESELTDIFEFVKDPSYQFTSSDPNKAPKTPVFVIGACAHGHPAKEVDYISKAISISNYHLSAACCASRIAFAFEVLWGIV